MTNRNADHDWLSPLLKLIADLFYLIVFGLFLLSQWLTGLFLRYVLNPVCDYIFDRSDGLVILASAALWVVIGWLCLPLLIQYDADTADVWSLFWQVTLVALGWGIAIGGSLVLTWWSEAEIQTSPPDFADVTGLPRDFYHAPANNGRDQLPEPEPDELKGLVLGVEWQQAHK